MKAFDFPKRLVILNALLKDSTSFQCETHRRISFFFFNPFSDNQVHAMSFTDCLQTEEIKIGNSFSLFPAFCEGKIYFLNFFF